MHRTTSHNAQPISNTPLRDGSLCTANVLALFSTRRLYCLFANSYDVLIKHVELGSVLGYAALFTFSHRLAL